jgi:hypothetical protein
MNHSYYVVQVEFLYKWHDVPGSKFHFDPTDPEEQKQGLATTKKHYLSAQKRAKAYRHRILFVSVIEQTSAADS